MLDHFDTKYIVKVKSMMENGYKELHDPIDTILDVIIELGFTSVRHWMIVENEISNSFCFVLSRSLGIEGLNDRYGYQLQITDCSIFSDIPKYDFDRVNTNTRVFAHSLDQVNLNNSINMVNEDLGLKSKYYVHIPITCHGKLHGQISCSFDSGYESLTCEYKDGLSILGMMLGDYMLLHAQKKLDYAIKQFDSKEGKLVRLRDSRAALTLITKIIRELMAAECATAFDYNWYAGKLTSVCEHTAVEEISPCNKGDDVFSENEYITGKAYHNSKFHYIYNLTQFAEKYPELIKDSSLLKYMKGRNGGSLAYGLIGQREHKSLIRVFNKERDYRVPFNLFETDALKQACIYFSKAYDDIVSYSQLDRMQRLAVSITDNISDINGICEVVNRSLSDEWISDMIVFGKLDSEINATIFYKSTDSTFRKFTQIPSDFIKECLHTTNLAWIPLKAYSSSASKTTCIESLMLNNGYIGMLVVPNDFENYMGGLGIPLCFAPRIIDGTPKLPAMHESNIKAYASILSRLIWFSRNALASDKAQKLLGTIGHEFKSPTRRIGKISLRIASAIKGTIREYPEFRKIEYKRFNINDDNPNYKKVQLYDFLQEQAEKIQDLAQSSRISVDTAALLAQSTNSEIELTFEQINVHHLAKRVAMDVVDELNTLQGERGLSCKFVFNDAFDSLKTLVCDKYIVEKILENIFRNALKYSIPPGKRRPIIINVNANPQEGSYLNIQVTNWGVPIHEEDYEEIFLPYNRGEERVVDKIRARKGMGIGLYIARMYAMSHGGNIALVHSKKTFHDISRRDSEGGLTQFEIRLSTRFEKSTCKYNITNNKHIKTEV